MENEYIPEILSIQKLCSLLGISRSRYYQLLNDQFILPPVYALDSRRPFYTRQMAQTNMNVIMNNVGINNKICLFYNTSRRTGARVKPATSKGHKQRLVSMAPHS